jgi:diaminopimelate decarboxylase
MKTETLTRKWPELEYRSGELYFEGVCLEHLAIKHGTPAYVYSAAVLRDNYRAYDEAFGGRPHQVCYAMKANGNLSVLRLLAEMGSGLDIVSAGELFRAQQAGVSADKITFSGVAKTDNEIIAAIDAGILMFNVESAQELDTIASLAGHMGKVAPISMRVNPDINAKTHPKITTGMKHNKFGVGVDVVMDLYRQAAADERLQVVGIQAHIGSQITSKQPHHDACERLCALYDNLVAEGITPTHLSLGGGLGIRYQNETPTGIGEFVRNLCSVIGKRPVTVIMEPGRSISGDAGVLLTRVVYTKSNDVKNFVMIDAGMTTLARPCIYGAYHTILPLQDEDRPEQVVDVVGPICESTDVMAHDRSLPEPKRGDVLAILSAGAYGFTMSSNYNDQLRPCEILVNGEEARIIRERETYEDMIRGE